MAKSIPAQLPMFSLTSCEDSPSATSSPGSAAGATRSGSPDGLTTALSGPAPVPVSPSRQRGAKLGETIRATFGRRGFSSSASANLTSSLVSRLKARLVTDGSILFAMTWKQKATPSGRLVYRLAASGRRTSGSGCGSWPTPNAGPQNDTDTKWEARRAELKAKHMNGNGFGMTLGTASQLASWATPAARDYLSNEAGPAHHAARIKQTRGKPLSEQAHQLAPWATPRVVTGGPESAERKQELGRTESGGGDLQAQELSSWATPVAANADKESPRPNTPRPQLPWQASQTLGLISPGSPAETGKPGQLNPRFSGFLMGYPPSWDMCAMKVESRASRRSLQKPPTE